MYSSNEVAKILGISRVTVFNWIKSGRLPATKVGGSYLIDKKAIDSEKKLRTLSEYDRNEIRQFTYLLIRDYGALLESITSHV